MKSKYLGGVIAALLFVLCLVASPVLAQSTTCQSLYQLIWAQTAVAESLQAQLNAAVAKLDADTQICSDGGVGCSDVIMIDAQNVADLSYRLQNEMRLISTAQAQLGYNRCS